MNDIGSGVYDDEYDAQDGLDVEGEVPIVSDDSEMFELETQGQISDGIDSLGSMEEIKTENWENLEGDERLNALQNVENSMAEIQNRPPVTVEAVEMPETEYGGYDGKGIKINQEQLNGGASVQENVDTIIHEGRHAYQDYVINNPETISDQEVVGEWAENWDNYLDGQTYGGELYMDQPVERDAWSYAGEIRTGLYGK